MSDAIVLAPGAGEVISDRAERTVRIKVGTAAIAVTETRYEGGERGPDPHVHFGHTDAFYVLEGEVTYGLGPDVELTEAPARSFVAAPPRVVHTFRNEGPARARYLNFHAPSGAFADYLRAMRDGGEADWFDQRDPPADGGRPRDDAVVLLPGAGERIEAGASTLVLKATSDGTDGMFFLSETTVPAGFPGPPPHRHRELHDMFYVLEGTLTLRNGAEEVAAPPGTFAYFPPGAVHTFSNGTDEPARFLNFNTPAGWERYMRELGAALADGSPTPEKIGAIASSYDFEAA